jgi:hypothetical protein
MKHKKPIPPAAPPEEEIQEEIQEDVGAKEPERHVMERPDGFYWRSVDSGEEYGPFETLAEAEVDMLAGGDSSNLESADLQEAESDIGVSEWIDPETGGPAEDSVPRIEDH